MNKYSLIAILSALFYALGIPISKLILLEEVNPVVLGGFTYLGAGIGFLLFNFRNMFKFKNPLTLKELPYTVAMVIFDILAIALLMFGISKTNSYTASLLSNFEIVSTSLIAFIVFKEKISKKIWIAIVLIIIASLILTHKTSLTFNFSPGAILVLFAYLFWGMENNCTKILSSKNSSEITIIKGIFSGIGSLLIANLFHFPIPELHIILFISFIGCISYGVSVSMYIYSQNKLGAAKTAGYFSFAPYIAVILSIILLKEIPETSFYIALLIMMIAGYLIYKDSIKESHS